MKRFIIIAAALSLFASSCKTVDMERRVHDTGIRRSFSEHGLLEMPAEIIWPKPEAQEPEVVIIERPVFIPEEAPVPPAAEARGRRR